MEMLRSQRRKTGGPFSEVHGHGDVKVSEEKDGWSFFRGSWTWRCKGERSQRRKTGGPFFRGSWTWRCKGERSQRR